MSINAHPNESFSLCFDVLIGTEVRFLVLTRQEQEATSTATGSDEKSNDPRGYAKQWAE